MCVYCVYIYIVYLHKYTQYTLGLNDFWFLKSTFMWWKSVRSQLVADDVINEQISLELWQTLLTAMAYDTVTAHKAITLL